MGRRHDARPENGRKIRRPVKHGRHKKDKTQLHKLRGLKGKAADADGQLGAEAPAARHANHQEKKQSPDPVDPRNLRQLPDVINDHRYYKAHRRSQDHQDKLAQGPFGGNAVQHDESRGQKHAAVIQKKSGNPPVQPPGKEQVSQKKQRLRSAQQHLLHILGPKPGYRVRQDKNQKHENHLIPAEAVPVLRVLIGEIPEIVIRIYGNQQDHQIPCQLCHNICHVTRSFESFIRAI